MEDSVNKSNLETTNMHNRNKEHDDQHHKGQHKQPDEDQHNGGQHHEGQHKQPDGFEQHDEDEDDTAPGLADSSRLGSSPSQKSTASPKSACSGPATNPNSPSSSGSFSDRDHVQPNALRIRRGDPDVPKDLTEVPEDSMEYREMRTCVNAAMYILSRTKTRDAMVVYSIGVVDSMEIRDSAEPSEQKRSTAGDLEVHGGGMKQAIDKWLEKLRRRFPDLYINPSVGPNYAYTMRFTWGDHIDDYEPEYAADISVHAELFDRMCTLKKKMTEYNAAYTQGWTSKLNTLEVRVREARNSHDEDAIAAAESDLRNYERRYDEMGKFTDNYKIHYERTLFILAITLAHECFHVLTGYWTGTDKEVTPPRFYGDSRKSGRGEAGEWWEYNHGFNGLANLVWNNRGKNQDDPYPLDNEKLSAGIPLLKQKRYRDDESVDGAEWRLISHAFIRDVLEKGFSEKPMLAPKATPTDDTDFDEKFTTVVDIPGNEQSTANSPGSSAKAGAPRSDRSVRDRLLMVCEDCGREEQSVPLGCRGPKPTASPPA